MSKELIFGTEEWKKALTERVKFPSMFAVYFGLIKENGDRTMHAVAIETKSTDPSNMKFGSISPTLGMVLSPVDWSLIDIYYIKSADEYMKKLTELGNKWGVKFNNEPEDKKTTIEEKIKTMTLKTLLTNIDNDLKEDGDTGAHLEMTIEEYLKSLFNLNEEKNNDK